MRSPLGPIQKRAQQFREVFGTSATSEHATLNNSVQPIRIAALNPHFLERRVFEMRVFQGDVERPTRIVQRLQLNTVPMLPITIALRLEPVLQSLELVSHAETRVREL
jgi:hypothetical protein